MFSELSRFMPHGHCFLWKPSILWTFVISDITIALAYFSISASLLLFLKTRPLLPYRWVIQLFSAFIFWCGMTHIFDIIVLWFPMYSLHGVVKAITALISIGTALMLLPLAPRMIRATTEFEDTKNTK